MAFDISVALTWILFLALFPITFFWLRRVWRIVVKKDFSEVGLKRGVEPPNQAKFAPYSAVINLVGAGVILTVIFGVVSGRYDYETWSAIAGVTIWGKLIADFILSRHAHPIVVKKRGKADPATDKSGQ